MNAKLTILILVAMIAAVLVPVSAENVYVDRNPALFDVPPPDAYGYVVFYIRAGGSAQDLNVWIGNDAKNATFDPTYNPDKTVIPGQNPDFLKVKVLPDGVSKPEQLASGNYTAYLQKGNGDQLEQIPFKIGGGGTEHVLFLGAAVSSAEERKCVPIYTIIEATYGSGGCWYVTIIDVPAWDETIEHPAETHVVHHPEVNHTETVIDVPAWDETVVDQEAWDEIIEHPAVTHEEFVVDGNYYIHDWKYFYGHGWKVKCSNHAEHGDGWHDQTSACTEAYGHYETVVDVPAWVETIHHEAVTHVVHHEAITHEETVVDTPAWDETVVDKEPWTETIHHPEITHEEQQCNEMVDVTASVQSVVSSGNHQFYFDTDREDGGIFSIADELLYAMSNPSEQGFLNTATISYETSCGASGTLTGTDFCVFDVEKGTVECGAVPA